MNSHASTLEPNRPSEDRIDLTEQLSPAGSFQLVGAKLVLPGKVIESGYLTVEDRPQLETYARSKGRTILCIPDGGGVSVLGDSWEPFGEITVIT